MVTPADATREYGDPNPAFTGNVVGLKNSDAITASYATAATLASAVGSYDITATLNDPGAKLGNYTVPTKTGKLTITARLVTITADPKTKVYGETDPGLT